MTNAHQKKEIKSSNTINSVVAGIAGVVAGGMAVATAVVMSDKKTQKKVKEALTNVKEQAVGYIEDMQKQAHGKRDEIDEKLTRGKERVKKVVNATKD